MTKQLFSKLDPATFLNTPASGVLQTMLLLPEHQAYSHKITGVLSECLQRLSAVMDIGDNRAREATLLMWRNHYLERIDNLPAPDKLKTYAKNIVITYCRECLHQTRTRDTRSNKITFDIREIGGTLFPHITFNSPQTGRKLTLKLTNRSRSTSTIIVGGGKWQNNRNLER